MPRYQHQMTAHSLFILLYFPPPLHPPFATSKTLTAPLPLHRDPRSHFDLSPENEPTATEKFVENNSIADFVRFSKPSTSSSSSSSDDELQTAVVSYRKKFPYSLLKPFLRVDLVSTIHIADKQ